MNDRKKRLVGDKIPTLTDKFSTSFPKAAWEVPEGQVVILEKLQVTKFHHPEEKRARIQTTYYTKCHKASPATAELFDHVTLGDFSGVGEFLGFPKGLNIYPR